MKLKTILSPLFAVVLLAVSPSAFAGDMPLVACNDEDRKHNARIYGEYGDNSSHYVLIAMAKCTDLAGERERLLRLVADIGIPAGKYLLGQFYYTENWESKRTDNPEHLKKALPLFMETLEDALDNSEYPMITIRKRKYDSGELPYRKFNESYYEMKLAIASNANILMHYTIATFPQHFSVEEMESYFMQYKDRYENITQRLLVDEEHKRIFTNAFKLRDESLNGLDSDYRKVHGLFYDKQFNDFFNLAARVFFNSDVLSDFYEERYGESEESAAEESEELAADELAEYAAERFAGLSAAEQADFCNFIRDPQKPCFCWDRDICTEPENPDYGYLLDDYIPPQENADEVSGYTAAKFANLSDDDKLDYCSNIRVPQQPCFCQEFFRPGIPCTEPENVDYGYLADDYVPPQETAEE